MMKLKSWLQMRKRRRRQLLCYLRALTCQLVELNDDSDRSTIVVKSRDFSLDSEPVKTVGLQSAHENRELRIAYQGTLYSENNHTASSLNKLLFSNKTVFFKLK
jgi:hypothetical protein